MRPRTRFLPLNRSVSLGLGAIFALRVSALSCDPPVNPCTCAFKFKHDVSDLVDIGLAPWLDLYTAAGSPLLSVRLARLFVGGLPGSPFVVVTAARSRCAVFQ